MYDFYTNNNNSSHKRSNENTFVNVDKQEAALTYSRQAQRVRLAYWTMYNQTLVPFC